MGLFLFFILCNVLLFLSKLVPFESRNADVPTVYSILFMVALNISRVVLTALDEFGKQADLI